MSNSSKVYPTAIELSKVVTNLSCPEEGCTNVFTSGSNLNLHLVKIHKKSQLQQSDDTKKEFHCPETDCVYHDKLFFKNLKLLKQHFLKVHGERTFSCESCNKGFSTDAARRNHTEYCGVIFHCCDCDVSYNCYETLKTHGRRKKHNVLEKVAYKANSNWMLPSGSHSEDKLVPKQQVLLPKTSRSVTLIIKPIELKKQVNQLDKCLQTDSTHEASKPTQISTETQTIEIYELKRSSQSELPEDRKTTNTTQTDSIDSKSQSCNTSFNLNDLDLTDVLNIERSSSSTQTCAANLDFDTNFFNCNSETQTDFMFQDEIMNVCDYYSHMYTQTCEDFLLDAMGFNDSHTQTAFDDAAKNAESQTVYGKWNTLGCRDMASMETQTDVELKQMLEEINA